MIPPAQRRVRTLSHGTMRILPTSRSTDSVLTTGAVAAGAVPA